MSVRQIDREAVRHFVYFLLDADGIPVYIGHSSNVAARIRSHASDARHPYAEKNWGHRKTWLFECRSVTMLGPFTWPAALRVERAEIERHQPVGNIALTTRDPRPAVAAASARRRSA